MRSIDLVNIYRQLFSLKQPDYNDGNCLDIVNDIYLLTDDEVLYDHLFLKLKPKRCCLPYYESDSGLKAGTNSGTIEAILFYDRKFKVHYTTKNLYQLIIGAFEYEMEVMNLIQIFIKNPIEIESIIDETNCDKYDLCWDSIYKTKSDLEPRGRVEFQQGACSSLRKGEQKSLTQSSSFVSELGTFGYSPQLEEEERWDILKEAVEVIGFDEVIKHINCLISAHRKMKTKDISKGTFKLEHDLKKLRRYY